MKHQREIGDVVSAEVEDALVALRAFFGASPHGNREVAYVAQQARGQCQVATVEASKVLSFDAFSPTVQLRGLTMAIKVDGGGLTGTSLNAPTDYVRWLGELRAGMRG
ncbi:hypothetical protein ACTJKJ_26625 [Roseateles sp. 22389]|uniref:hypothetical protein n=1 Tax=Roseateles sp. 22389 TaxID=3453916 RepID=UPI003F8719FA